MTCQETTKARLECKKPTSEDMEPETELEEKMDVWIADMKDGGKERTACQEATEANPEKMGPHPGEKGAKMER
jgi:hypothetical protein